MKLWLVTRRKTLANKQKNPAVTNCVKQLLLPNPFSSFFIHFYFLQSNKYFARLSNSVIVISQKNHFFKPCKTCVKPQIPLRKSPENKHFLESCQYIAVAYEKYSNHCFFSSQIALKFRILQGFISISRYRSFLLIYYIFCKKVQNEANHFRL